MSSAKPSILAVDDEEINLELVSIIFASKGYNIILAENGKIAIEKALKYEPDIILLDIILPEMDGYEICKTLKKNELTRNIPIIFFSAKIDKESILKGFKLGAIDYIKKPITEDELITRVEVRLELEKANRAVEIEQKKRQKTEKDLEKSEEKYKHLTQVLGEGVAIANLNEEFTFANPAAEKIFGVAENQLVGKNLVEFIDQDQLKIVNNESANRKKNKSTSYELDITRPNKEKRHLLITATPQYSNIGELTGTSAIFRDITERKISEQALIKSEKKYRILTETMKDVVGSFSIGGKLLYMSPSVTKFGGYQPEEEIGNHISKYIAKKSDLKRVLELFAKVAVNHKSGLFTFVFQAKNKKPFPVELTYAPLLVRNEQYAILVVMRDITKRKKAEQEIQKLSIAVEQSAISMVITDLDGKIEYTNPKFTEQTGYSAKEVKGQNPRLLNAGSQPKKHYTDLWKKISAGEVWRGEFHNVAKNGNFFWEKATITPLKSDKGKIHKYLAIKEDITEQKEIEIELKIYRNSLEELVVERTEQLEMSRNKFKNIFDSSSDAIIITDLQGNYLDFNKRAIDRIGLRPDEITKLNFIKFHNSEGPQTHEDYFEDVIKHGNMVFPTSFVTNKKTIHIELSGTLIKHNNKNAILHVSRDITLRKEEEKLKLKTIIETEEKERKRFAKDLHDGLGATLSAAKMYLNIVKRSKPGSVRALKMLDESISLIEEAGKDAKKIAVNIRPHDLSHFGLAVSLQNFCDRLSSLGSIKINLNVKNFKVLLDKDIELNLFRTINELINNTFKYADAKEITIELYSEQNKAIITYSDNGKGFDFEKVMKSKKRGTGLDNIIFRTKLSGGLAKIMSKPSKGMSVKIIIDPNKAAN